MKKKKKKKTDSPTEQIAVQPTIQVKEGEHPEAVDEAEKILLKNCRELGIFQRAGELVEVITLPKSLASSGLSRPRGTVMLRPLPLPALSETFERLIIFGRWNAKQKKLITCNCPDRLTRAYLNRQGKWKLPVLTGIICAPLVRPDGSLLDAPGYDDATGLFFATEETWPPVPNEPRREDAREALETLRAPFEEFPWAAEEGITADHNRAVLVAAILTAIERRILGACPVFGFTAPTPRTGKSLLAESIAIIAIGKPAPVTAVSTEQEELRKAFTAALREGQSIINLDNIEGILRSPDLCKIITQAEFSDRLLGETKMLELPTNVMWTATGNNFAFGGDLAQRALLCRIETKKERPEDRSFKIPNLPTYLTEHRQKLVVAALTILRAFSVEERPKQDVKPWGGFDDWSRLIREALVWAGEADPCATRTAAIGDEPDTENTAEALRQLAAAFPGKTFILEEAIKRANESNGNLRAALEHVVPEELDTKRLSYWARKWNKRTVGGLQLVNSGRGTNARNWKIEIVWEPKP
jgi:hypothetical protein